MIFRAKIRTGPFVCVTILGLGRTRGAIDMEAPPPAPAWLHRASTFFTSSDVVINAAIHADSRATSLSSSGPVDGDQTPLTLPLVVAMVILLLVLMALVVTLATNCCAQGPCAFEHRARTRVSSKLRSATISMADGGNLGCTLARAVSEDDIDDASAGHAVRVVSVTAGARLQQAGLAEGDVILSIDGERVHAHRRAMEVLETAHHQRRARIDIKYRRYNADDESDGTVMDSLVPANSGLASVEEPGEGDYNL